MGIGQAILTNNVLKNIRVSVDGSPLYKAGGITIDWSTVAATGSDVTLPNGAIIRSGQKYLRYGQIMCRIGVAEVQTYTWTGGPTAGAATLTFPATSDRPTEATSALAYNVSAADFQAALQLVGRIGPNGATVGRTGAGSAGDPYIYTVTFNKSVGDVAPATATHTFTGGTTPTVTVGTTTAGGATSGYFGPYDASANDGRQTLSRGDCYIMDETVLQYGSGTSLLSMATDHHGSAIEGGLLWRDRVLHSAAQTTSLARGPTLANVETAFPLARWVTDVR